MLYSFRSRSKTIRQCERLMERNGMVRACVVRIKVYTSGKKEEAERKHLCSKQIYVRLKTTTITIKKNYRFSDLLGHRNPFLTISF